MALNRPNPPLAVKTAFREGLPRFTRLTDLSKSDGQQVFTLRLQDIACGGGIERARAVGWKFMGGDASGLAVAGVVKSNANRPLLIGLSHGSAVGAHLDASDWVKTLPEVQANDYELRVLLIPGLLLETFWLKSTGNLPDLVVLFRKATNEIECKKAYSMERFLALARPWAEKGLQFRF
jgi:hypothetical protein